jgi:hypothetical protein
VFFNAAEVMADFRAASILFAQWHFAKTASKSCLIVLSLSFFVKILLTDEAVLMH